METESEYAKVQVRADEDDVLMIVDGGPIAMTPDEADKLARKLRAAAKDARAAAHWSGFPVFDFGIELVTSRVNTPVQSLWFRDRQIMGSHYNYDTSLATWVHYDPDADTLVYHDEVK